MCDVRVQVPVASTASRCGAENSFTELSEQLHTCTTKLFRREKEKKKKKKSQMQGQEGEPARTEKKAGSVGENAKKKKKKERKGKKQTFTSCPHGVSD